MSKVVYTVLFTVALAGAIYPTMAQAPYPADLLEEAQQQFSQRQYDSAIYYAELAVNDSVENPDLAPVYYVLGRAQRRMGQLAYAQDNLVNAIRLTQDSTLIARAHYELGKCYRDKVQPDVAIYHYQRALLFNPDTLDLAQIYEGIADEYNYFYYDYTQAEIFYEKALHFLQSLQAPNEALLLRLLYNIANTYQLKGDFFTALNYAQRATRLAQETESVNLTLCYALLGAIYQQQKEYDLAIIVYNDAIKQSKRTGNKNNPELVKNYNNLGLLYAALEQYQKAIAYYQQALSIASLNQYPEAPSDLADSYQYLGIAHYQLHNFSTSGDFLNQALQLKRTFYGHQHSEVASVLDAFSSLHKEQNQVDSALYFQQLALIARVPGFSEQNIKKNPTWQQLQNYTQSFHPLIEKGNLLYERYSQSHANNDLDMAIATFLLADSLMHVHRVSYEYENSQLQLLESQKPMYETALSSCYLMFKATQDKQYLHHALYFMERSKAALLWDVLRDITTKSSLGVSDSLQRTERSLRTQLARVVNDIADFKRDTDADTADLHYLQQKRFQLLRQQHDLQETMLASYPNYVQLKYASPDLPWEKLQQRLDQDQQHILELFWGDTFLYSMHLSSNSLRFHRTEISDTLLGSIDQIQQVLKRGPTSEYYQKETEQYVNAAFTIYDQVFTPLFDADLPNSLTVIPDGPLAYLPFEALLTHRVNATEDLDYRKIPYLLQETTIQYTPSLQVLLNTDESSRANNVQFRLLAFGFTDQQQRMSVTNNHRLVALPGTIQELSAISALTSARTFSGGEASETRFKQDAESYQVIHLALHGRADANNPNNNVLFFPAAADSVNDGELHSFELYDMRLTETKLAVLSACETGTGSWKAGEGVYSMGRGFAYAGCPSVITSLWKVNDVTTSRIMPILYRFLFRGMKIDRALQKAKIQYIRQANKYQAHPSYWAAFILQGESSPIVQYRHTYMAGTIILLVSFAYFIAGLILKKKTGAMQPATL